MADDLTHLTALLRNEINVPQGDDERISAKLDTAIVYVDSAIGGQTVDRNVRDDCIISCAADLYNSRDARLGVMNMSDSTVEPFRVSTDPLRSVWPKLNAAGIMTGRLAVA